jgi:hypothetical protein
MARRLIRLMPESNAATPSAPKRHPIPVAGRVDFAAV